MNEAETRLKKIDPKLAELGWNIIPTSRILPEYYIAPGRVAKVELTTSKKGKNADYVLEYKGRKLAVIEAKSDEQIVNLGVDQAKKYAAMLDIRFTYACNGDEIYFIDMGVTDGTDANGNPIYTIPSTEHLIEKFPTPDELWLMTYPVKHHWADLFRDCPYNRDGGKSPRYYQENAIDRVLAAIANEQKRILLTMATGTGKTYTAFQICWKLMKTKWNKQGNPNEPHILFITDRNILADQALLDFDRFDQNAICRITPKYLNDPKNNNKVPMGRSIYFTIFQTIMGEDPTGQPYYKQYDKDFFDFIIIDECHRGIANDESRWRDITEYFTTAYQLGMTATPRRTENTNTYNYFGNPVYSYSLKQGIDDGFLVPFRVKESESNIDDYQYDPADFVIEGEIDPDKIYTEKDFYSGKIEMRQRDEHRVKELLNQIDPDEKTIIFCGTQNHAMQIRDMVNQYKKRPDSNYCVRVTADDGDAGEADLRLFQKNDKLRPTILTTSYKLSTGVDARNIRNIVLMRPVNSMVEFKQIIGRGTRLFTDKYFFTIYDFVGASSHFQDADWDGDPFCPICGNFPCTCGKTPKPGPKPGGGQGGGGGRLPEGPQGPNPQPDKPKTIRVKLSKDHVAELHTDWTEKIQYDDKLLTIQEFIQELFGHLPRFFNSVEDLRIQWQSPVTRAHLVQQLEDEGFSEDKLAVVRKVLNMEKCDLLDVLEYLAYNTAPMERERRVELVKQDYFQHISQQQQQFVDFIMNLYVANGYKELGEDKLSTLVKMKYQTTTDALRSLQTDVAGLKDMFYDFQKQLYNSPVVNRASSQAATSSQASAQSHAFTPYTPADDAMPQAAEQPPVYNITVNGDLHINGNLNEFSNE